MKHSLARLDAKCPYHSTGKKYREHLLSPTDETAAAFDRLNDSLDAVSSQTGDDRIRSMQVIEGSLYGFMSIGMDAIFSLVLDEEYTLFRTTPLPKGKLFWNDFLMRYYNLFHHATTRWTHARYEHAQEQQQPTGAGDIAYRCAQVTQETITGKEYTQVFPSFGDGIIIYGRFARAIADVYAQSRNKEISKEEYTQALYSGSFSKILLQLMVNNGWAFMNFILDLEEERNEYIEEKPYIFPSERFDPAHFELGDDLELKIREEKIASYKQKMGTDWTGHMMKDLSHPGYHFNCPLLYSERSREFIDFLNAELLKHYFA